MQYMGIDGGGSTLRIIVVDEALQPRVELAYGTANPNLIGRDTAAEHIQQAMRDALQTVDSVVAVGIGIAGASAEYADNWLREVVASVLPDTYTVPASDNEIALVGALGLSPGILILAGTGSVVFGKNSDGDTLQVGGWGYLLGDEGSGYWIGLQALRQVTQVYDAGASCPLAERISHTLDLDTPRHIIEYVYLAENSVPRIAALAPVVLQAAEDGIQTARTIIQQAVGHLYQQAQLVSDRLHIEQPPFAFAGGLLEHDTMLSRLLVTRLGLSTKPIAKHKPVIGAALLAKYHYEKQRF